MSVHKLIFRLDFEPNFNIVDSTGKILRLLQEAGKRKHWPDLGETAEKHSISGRNISKEEGWLTSITIDPVAISGHIESLQGIPIEKIEDSKPVSRLFKITNEFRREFHINNLKRTGFRLFLFEENPKVNKKNVKKAFLHLFDKDLINSLSEVLGTFTDSGIGFDGTHDDGIQFHLHWGPYTQGELKRHLQEFGQLYKHCDTDPFKSQDDGLIVTVDIDFFEKDHQLHETTSFAKWCRPVIDRAVIMRENILKYLFLKYKEEV